MNDLLLLEKLNSSLAAGLSSIGGGLFHKLPFSTIPQGARIEQNPIIVRRFDQFPIDQLNLLRGIDFLLAESIDVLNLSLGMVDTVFDPNHPLQVATHLVHEYGIPVVVAAGNGGPELHTMQALAQAPWVIAVGATDAKGQLMQSSSRGDPSGAQPTVVADGSLPARDDRFPEPCTSFATPKVSGLVVWISKSLELLINDLWDQQYGSWTALSRRVRMPIAGVADTGCDPDKLPEYAPLAGSIYATGSDHVQISRSDRERQWYEGLMKTLRENNVEIEIAANPDTIQRCLQRAARPMPGCAAHETGAGFVSPAEISKFFSSFTPSCFITTLCPETSIQMPQTTIQQMDERLGPLWDEKKVLALCDLFGCGIRLAIAKVV